MATALRPPSTWARDLPATPRGTLCTRSPSCAEGPVRIDAGIVRQSLDCLFRSRGENRLAPGCPTKPELDRVLPMVSPKNARFDPKAESTPDLPPPHPAARIPHFHRISQKEKGPKRKTRLLLPISSPEIILGEVPSSWQVTASGQHPGEPALTDLEPRHTLFGLTYPPAVSCPKDGEPLTGPGPARR